MKTIELLHWTKGGTGITNFYNDPDVYEEAVKEYNDSRLVIHPMPCEPGRHGAKSLHWIGNKLPDLSRFWTLFRTLECDKRFDEQFSSTVGKSEQP